jgi:hypothetical protein
MTGGHPEPKAWPSVPADRDLPPGRHDLHRENLMSHIRNERPLAPARSPARPPPVPAAARAAAGWPPP